MSFSKAVCVFYVDSRLSDPRFFKNNAHVDFIDKNLDNVRFFKVTSTTAIGEQLTAINYVDQDISKSVDESSLVGLEPIETR